MYGPTHRQTDRQTDRRTDRQTDRIHILYVYVGLAQARPNKHYCILSHLKFLYIGMRFTLLQGSFQDTIWLLIFMGFNFLWVFLSTKINEIYKLSVQVIRLYTTKI